jgi:hypothetical protein
MRTKQDRFFRGLRAKARIAALRREVEVFRQISFRGLSTACKNLPIKRHGRSNSLSDLRIGPNCNIRLDTARMARLRQGPGMDGSDGAVGKKARWALFATLFATVVTAAPPAAIGQSFPSSSAAGISGGLLPREFVVSRRLVGQIFPEIVQKASTGRNGTAVGNPEAKDFSPDRSLRATLLAAIPEDNCNWTL